MGYNLQSLKYLGSAYAFLILSVHFSSAGLLKDIREAAEPKDMEYKLPLGEPATENVEPKQADLVTSESSPVKANVAITPSEESNLLQTLQSSISKLSTVLHERADNIDTINYGLKKTCKPGDVLCQTKLQMGLGNGNNPIKTELSKAVINSFGTMMGEMVNSTISRGMVEFMSKHGSTHGETLQEEHKAMVQMAANVLQTVSSRVIKSFTFFVQMAISGAMWDLFHQLMNGVTTAYDHHQKSMNEVRGAMALTNSPADIPKPSQLQIFDPVKTLLNAGALTALTNPGFDLVGSLKNNLFNGDTNELRKREAQTSNYISSPVLTPYGEMKAIA